ncbi:HWE histidine kinase domain-containing protein [Gymnodinialimonas sp. 2305UL16-5]|uniref:sensor histidine kinase n=1 Tax=Gymnodinialimonas mytili TaxID=3126503 RepID=UPI0030A71FE1
MTENDLKQRPVADIADPTERRIQAALRAARIGVFEFEPQTNTAFWDERVRELWGISGNDRITYEMVLAQVHPDDRALHDAGTAKALDPDGDGRMDMTYRVSPKSGGPMRWIRAEAECAFENGIPMRLVGTVKDVTEQREAAERNRLLVNELQHRVKNTLATAVAVVSLSREGADGIDTYFSAVDERLRALSASHDLLRRTDWSPVALTDLLRSAAMTLLSPEEYRQRILFSGDDVEFPAKAVMTMGMALHELVVNAAKHGALSNQDGRIDVTLQSANGGDILTWTESAGPEPTEITGRQSGFGTLLLKEILPLELSGKSALAYGADGFEYNLTVPSLERRRA